jgi:hypothetical protein
VSVLRRWEWARQHVVFLAVRCARRLGLDVALPVEDRRVLERVVMPWFAARDDMVRVLFVGCDWYTRSYARLFAGREYWTLDRDPGRARYGSARHVTDTLANAGRHLPAGGLDLILCNGVIGWGLDERDAMEASLAVCHELLRPGGVLMLGWNDVKERKPELVTESIRLRQFSPWVFPPFGSARFLTPTANRHTFSFYERTTRLGTP